MYIVKSCCGIPLVVGNVLILIIALALQLGVFFFTINAETNVEGLSRSGRVAVKTVLLLVYIVVGWIGILTGKPGWLKCYMAVHLIYIVNCLVAGIWILCDPSTVSITRQDFNSDLEIQVSALALFIVAGLYFYFFVIIYSYYKEVRQKKEDKMKLIDEIEAEERFPRRIRHYPSVSTREL